MSEPVSAPEVPPEKRRRRPAVSCNLCRRRKIRCNREVPCSNCVRGKALCVYENGPVPISANGADHQPQPQSQQRPVQYVRQWPAESWSGGGGPPALGPSHGQPLAFRQPSSGTPSTGPASSESEPPSALPKKPLVEFPSLFGFAPDPEATQKCIQDLEERLAQAKALQKTTPTAKPKDAASSPTTSTTDSSLVGTATLVGTFEEADKTIGKPGSRTRSERWAKSSTAHKSRVYGQSHWGNTALLFRDIMETAEPHISDPTAKAVVGLQRCKMLARMIKAHRTPPWPLPLSPDLPSRDVADVLVASYMATIETMYRILHIPSFNASYAAFWANPNFAVDPSNTAFLVQLKLVLALGAITSDAGFSLRASAIRWTTEAHTYMVGPGVKSRLGIPYFQTSILHCLAREMDNVDGELAWINAGALLRTAIHVGLHRDPKLLPTRSVYVAEMRRRLWNTVIELCMQTSLQSGGPPLVDLADFDAEPPGNFDDSQLDPAEDTAEGRETPVARPKGKWTDSSMSIALRATLGVRIRVAKFLNDLNSRGTYQDALKIDSELRAAMKAIRKLVQNWQLQPPTAPDVPGPSGPAPFAAKAVDFILNRYLLSLHTPFFAMGFDNTAYAYTRKMVIEAALRMWQYAWPSNESHRDPNITSPSPNTNPHLLHRLITNGAGFFRGASVAAGFLLEAELRAQILEDPDTAEDAASPDPDYPGSLEMATLTTVRPDLINVIEGMKGWCLRSIETGETNVKAYLLAHLIAAQIEGLRRGVGRNTMRGMLVKAAEEAEATCLEIFEKMPGVQGEDAWDSVAMNGGAMEAVSHVGMGIGDGMVADGGTAGGLGERVEEWDFIMSSTLLSMGAVEPMNWTFNEDMGNGVAPPYWR